MPFLKIAPEDEGADALGVDGAVIVGPAGVLDCRRDVDKQSAVEPFLLFVKDNEDGADILSEERLELYPLPPTADGFGGIVFFCVSNHQIIMFRS